MDEAKNQLARLASAAGFDHFSYVGGRAFGARRGSHAMWVRPPTVLNDFPVEWLDTYHKQDFARVDPTISVTLAKRLPFAWDAERLRNAVAPDERAFLSSAHDFKLVRGLTIPVYGPTGDFAMFSFLGTGSSREFRKTIAAHGDRLHLSALYFHQVMAQHDTPAEDSVTLTAREAEMLYWTAAGKTSPEIAAIIGISEKTVQFHLYKAMKKLDVYSKAQAVAKAILLGLIAP